MHSIMRKNHSKNIGMYSLLPTDSAADRRGRRGVTIYHAASVPEMAGRRRHIRLSIGPRFQGHG